MDLESQTIVRDESAFDPAGDIPPMAQLDSLELSFTPLLRWRDALMRVFGLAVPRQVVAVVAVKKIMIQEGAPMVVLNCHYKGDATSQLVKAFPQANCPHEAPWDDCPDCRH